MRTYVYCRNKKGLSNSGYTGKPERWILFTEDDKKRFESSGVIPYGTNKPGTFTELKQ
jgi:hypothetical protein